MHFILTRILILLASGLAVYSRVYARQKASLPLEGLSADDFEIID